jgi:hypothetical protein
MALNEHRRGARTKHALGAWVRAVQTSALRFFAVCLFGQTAAFNDVYNLMSLPDFLHPIPLRSIGGVTMRSQDDQMLPAKCNAPTTTLVL